jgi:hypothetical protein
MLTPPDFTHQDLRHRSFRGQRLAGADFRGADLRGCNFSHANLTGANFEQAMLGQTQRQRLIWVGLAIATLLIIGHATSRLFFGVLGQTPADKVWNYVIALYISWGIAGISAGIRGLLKPLAQRWMQILSGTASGALAGFFYGGTLADLLQPDLPNSAAARWAIWGAVAGGLLVGSLACCWLTSSLAVMISIAGAIAAYGFALLVGTTAIAFLNTGHAAGWLLLLLLWVFLWLTLNAFAIALYEIRHAPGTQFRGANVSQTRFSRAQLQQGDFSGAIGVEGDGVVRG